MFSYEFCEIFKNMFFTEYPGRLFLFHALTQFFHSLTKYTLRKIYTDTSSKLWRISFYD